MNWIDSIKDYKPCNEQEKKDKEIILKCFSTMEDLLTRNNELAHITSSGFVVNSGRSKALLVHHNIFKSWALPGGHADGDGNLLEVALREAREETGIKKVSPALEDIFSIDVLPVIGHMKKGKYVASHLHLSIVYLLEADEDEVLEIKVDENSDVKWIPLDQVVAASNEPHMKKVYSKLIRRVLEI